MQEIVNNHSEFEDSSFDKDKNLPLELKLPRIDRMPPKEPYKQARSRTKLPSLKSQPLIQSMQFQTERKSDNNSTMGLGQVEKKVRMVMAEQNILEIDQSSQSDEDHFQKKINQNKELIKQTKRKNKEKNKGNQHNNKMSIQRKTAAHKSMKFDEKKIREPRQSSIENKNVKKKELVTAFYKNGGLNNFKDPSNNRQAPKSSTTLKQANPNRDLKEAKSQKEEFMPPNKILPSNPPKPSDSDRKVMKKQLSHKFLNPIQKNEQLFDAIHNYLDNPKRFESEINSQKIVKQKNQLQQKLRYYEQKLSKGDNIVRHKESAKSNVIQVQKQTDPKLVSSTQWRKISVADNNNMVHESSSFDQEVDRIGRYLLRNQKSLEKYVQNQKFLLEVQFAKRQGSKDHCLTISDKQSSP